MTTAISIPLWRRLWFTRFHDALRGRLDASLDWRSALAAGDLPIEIADAIGHVVRRTRLRRAEKLDVAGELVAHFQDGLSTGRTPQQLLNAFGDPKIAANLIRRAKKRSRPLVWHVWHWGCAAFAALALLYLGTGLVLLFGHPSIKSDYLAIINARASAVPEADRAWPLYRQALVEMGIRYGQSDQQSSPFGLSNNVRPSDANWQAAEQFLNDHQSAIIKLRAAGQRESLGLPASPSPQSLAPDDRALFSGQPATARREYPDLDERPMISTLLPHVQLLAGVAGVLATDCRRAALANDANVALADVFTQLAISRHIQEAPFFVTAYTATAIQATAHESIADVLSEHPQLWSNDQLRDLAHEIGRTDVNWARALEGERAAFYDTLQRVYTDNGNGDGHISQIGIDFIGKLSSSYRTGASSSSWWMNIGVSPVVLPAANLLIASRRDMAAMYDQSMSHLSRELNEPLWEWKPPAPDMDDYTAIARPRSGYRYCLVSLFVPPMSQGMKAAEAHSGARDGILIGLALELYHREYGEWPATLAALTRRWLPTLPVDRITGGSLHYKIVNDRPIVYSVGVDRDDDGGRLPSGRGESPDPNYAGPGFWTPAPVTSPANDGDWVIWSTAKNDEQ